MKFDPFAWNEVKPNEKIAHKKGWLRLRLSAPAPLYIESQGYEALAGVGTAFDLEVSEAVTFRAEAPKGTRIFVHAPFATTTIPSGEVFTNIDRMPDESGAVAEVRRAAREFEIERRAMLRDIRQQREALRAEVEAARRSDEPEPKSKRGPSEAKGEAVIEAAEDEAQAE